MRVIYKYTLDITDKQFIEVHKEAGTECQILYVGLDPNGVPCLWMELTKGTYVEKHEILILGTGMRVPGTAHHLGSFVQGQFVWHVYR